MRPPLLALVFMLAIAAPRLAPCQQSAPPAAPEIAEAIWIEYSSAQWAVPFSDWERARPGADCRQFQGDGSHPDVDEAWTHRCVTRGPSHLAEISFYLLDQNSPLVPRLSQVRIRTQAPISSPERIHELIANRLADRLGPPRSLGSSELTEVGSSYWREVRLWAASDFEILLFIDRQGPGRAVDDPRSPVVLLARHRTLLDAMAQGRRYRDAQLTQIHTDTEAEVNRRVVARMGRDFPSLEALLEGDPAQIDKQEAYRTLAALLDRIASAPPEPDLLMAASQLGEQLWFEDTEPLAPEVKQMLDDLARRGMPFHDAVLGGVWVYQGDFLRRIWRDYPTSEWGELAFLLLLERGWDTSATCAGGKDQFRVVIREGEQFLAQRPQSAYRDRVLFSLAEAYETWWSLSQAASCQNNSDRERSCDPYADSSEYQSGAPEAREKAIEYYQQVLSCSPVRPELASARLRVARLSAGFDTDRRTFFCVYD